MAGYSKTPLAKKLGIKPGFAVLVVNAPAAYDTIVDPMPEDVTLLHEARSGMAMVHLFTQSAAELAHQLPELQQLIQPNGMIWVSWPKKAAKVPTDVTEDTIREVALPLGLVDVKVCAVNEIWSGLKLVIRKENRR